MVPKFNSNLPLAVMWATVRKARPDHRFLETQSNSKAQDFVAFRLMVRAGSARYENGTVKIDNLKNLISKTPYTQKMLDNRYLRQQWGDDVDLPEWYVPSPQVKLRVAAQIRAMRTYESNLLTKL